MAVFLPDTVLDPTAGISATPTTASPLPSAAPSVQVSPPAGLTATMPPTIRAGVNLASLVIWIMLGSICMFVGYLMMMEFMTGSDVRQAYAHESPPSIQKQLDALDDWSGALSSTRPLSATQLENVKETIKTIEDWPDVTDEQKAALGKCAPPPTDSTKDEAVQTCIATIRKIVHMGPVILGTLKSKAAAEAVDKLITARKSLHEFWIQAAQLILLNLLLPLLTALFGYIFGTQQVQKTQ